MKSTEKMEDRLNRVDMHDFFLNKIDDAIEEERYIEASWLIYSCMVIVSLGRYRNIKNNVSIVVENVRKIKMN